MQGVTETLYEYYQEWVGALWNKYSSEPISQSVQTRVNDLNFHLAQHQHLQGEISDKYELARCETEGKKRKYNTCDHNVRDKIAQIKKSIIDFGDLVDKIKKDIDIDSDETSVLKAMNELMAAVTKLKEPNNVDKVYEWIDPVEYWNVGEYNTAVKMRDDALSELDTYQDLETPLRDQLADINGQIDKIKKERDTLLEFNHKYKSDYVPLDVQYEGEYEPPPSYSQEGTESVTENWSPPSAYAKIYGSS